MPQPVPLAERDTATLQQRRAELLALPREFTPRERADLRVLEAELSRRGVLSIGINF